MNSLVTTIGAKLALGPKLAPPLHVELASSSILSGPPPPPRDLPYPVLYPPVHVGRVEPETHGVTVGGHHVLIAGGGEGR